MTATGTGFIFLIGSGKAYVPGYFNFVLKVTGLHSPLQILSSSYRHGVS
jgi:hypothetical protein